MLIVQCNEISDISPQWITWAKRQWFLLFAHMLTHALVGTKSIWYISPNATSSASIVKPLAWHVAIYCGSIMAIKYITPTTSNRRSCWRDDKEILTLYCYCTPIFETCTHSGRRPSGDPKQQNTKQWSWSYIDRKQKNKRKEQPCK